MLVIINAQIWCDGLNSEGNHQTLRVSPSAPARLQAAALAAISGPNASESVGKVLLLFLHRSTNFLELLQAVSNQPVSALSPARARMQACARTCPDSGDAAANVATSQRMNIPMAPQLA